MGKVGYPWRAIEAPLLNELRSLERAELRHLFEVWREQRGELEHSEGFGEFNTRQHREWAIETGLIERLYTIDRGTTESLIERGIAAALIGDAGGRQQPERVAQMIRSHEQVLEGLFAFVRGERTLTPGYIKELHAEITKHQETATGVDLFRNKVEIPLLRGAYKKHPNNPTRPDGLIHEYCPPEQVASEMERLLALHAENAALSPEVQAAWLHHRFVQIHPFQDGNGRVARCLATLVLIRANWFPLVISDTRGERGAYLDALAAADSGDLGPLVELFATTQKQAFVQALGIARRVLRPQKVDQVIAAAKAQLEEREENFREAWQHAIHTANFLRQTALARFGEISGLLSKETGRFFQDPYFYPDTNETIEDRSHYFGRQIIDTAKQLGYYANTSEYRAWSRLLLLTGSRAEIILSFHGLGREFHGVLAVSAFFLRRVQTEEGEREIADFTPLTDEIFQINYREPEEDAEARFRDWLEDILLQGLELWRNGL